MSTVFVRMPSPAIRMDVVQSLAASSTPAQPFRTLFSQPDVCIAEIDTNERQRITSAGGIIYEDIRFQHFDDPRPAAPGETDAIDSLVAGSSLRDVVEQVEGPSAWSATRGRGSTIVIVDSGISPGLRELPSVRRSNHNLRTRYHGHHWHDAIGHGSMCAAIAAGSKDGGGRYDGIAPEADVLSARSDLTARDLTSIFDQLVQARVEGALPGPLVISNSYGLQCCQPMHILPQDHPFLTGIEAAIAKGIVVCFAAGNNHHDQVCNFDPGDCRPNTIWGANSHDGVLCVGTVNRDLSNRDPRTPHVNSSRGPGEWARTTVKPDCVAPTYGEVPWGDGYQTTAWWGTSGACPQVAGLAALILSVAPHLDPQAVSHIVRQTCRPLQHGRNCVGHGVIDCAAAIDAARVA